MSAGQRKNAVAANAWLTAYHYNRPRPEKQLKIQKAAGHIEKPAFLWYTGCWKKKTC
jgi:hypothetical protein